MPPLVSAIMPCAENAPKELKRRAIECFEAQTYKTKQLSVLTFNPEFSIGEARNYMIREYGRGSLVCHWDCDDYSDPRRIEYQVDKLRTCDVSGGSRIYYDDIVNEKAYIFDATKMRYKEPYLLGGTLCYWRRVWEQCNFDPWRTVGEDSAWQWALQGSIDNSLPLGYYVATRHGKNTSTIDVTSNGWSEVPRAEVLALMEHK